MIMIKKAHAELISGLMSLLEEEEKVMCQDIIDCLTKLDYIPQKQKVQGYVLSFKNNKVNQTIVKIGIRTKEIKKAFFSIKFYTCKNPPQKFSKAVQKAILSSKEQYKCCNCNVCGADIEERGYHYTYPDGKEFIRCGAYVVEIPNLVPDDIYDFNNLLIEQHEYFILRTK
jgi:hypothetical protein